MKRLWRTLLALWLAAALAAGGVTASALLDLDEPVGFYGDVNLDGAYNAADALVVLKRAVGKAKLNAKQTGVADVSGDGKIDASDALMILKYSVDKLDKFPAGMVFDSYTLTDTPYVDCDSTYKAYPASTFAYNTSFSVNGAYADDTTADTGFVMDNAGLRKNTIYLFSSAVLENVDVARLVYSLQGLVNRDFGRDADHTTLLYAMIEAADRPWLQVMQEEGAVLAGYETVNVDSWDAFFETFEAQIRACGLILWDGNVPATANVAATICGLDGYLPVLDKSPLCDRLKALNVPVKQSLVGLFGDGMKGLKLPGTNVASTGSAKNDAYRWAMAKYFDRCSANYLAYTLDGAVCIRGYDAYDDNPSALLSTSSVNCLQNHDYLIARRCFFFDLYPYQGDAACDDPAQVQTTRLTCPNGHTHNYVTDDLLGEDDAQCPVCFTRFAVNWDTAVSTSPAEPGVDNLTMCQLFDRRYQRANGAMGQLMGFPPWWVKYTRFADQGPQGEVWMEWLLSEYVSCYNMAKEADAQAPAAMTNGSAYYKYVPLQAQYDNKRSAYDPGVTYDPDTLYFTVYVGDYDSSAWLKQWVNTFWLKEDRARSTLPLTWCFNPNLSNRVPMIFQYVYDHKYPHEFIAAGDSGAGYVMPSGLFADKKMIQVGATRPAAYGNGDRTWAEYCKKLYERFDITATGFIINGSNHMSTSIMGMYRTFSPSGSLMQPTNVYMVNYKGTPYVHCHSGLGSNPDYAEMYRFATNEMGAYNLAAFRTVCLSPSRISAIVQNFTDYVAEKGEKVQYLELYSFLDMAKASGKGEKIN